MKNVNRKTQIQRLAVLASLIERGIFSKTQIIEKISHRFNHTFSQSQIEKDIFTLKMEFDAPIKCDRSKNIYLFEEEYCFKTAFINYWGL